MSTMEGEEEEERTVSNGYRVAEPKREVVCARIAELKVERWMGCAATQSK